MLAACGQEVVPQVSKPVHVPLQADRDPGGGLMGQSAASARSAFISPPEMHIKEGLPPPDR